jgi:glutaredoxin
VALFRRIAPLLLLIAAGWTGVQVIERVGGERIAREMAANAKAGDIMMLSSDTCTYCDQARAWFHQHGVTFGECSIERDAACAQAYRALRSPGTPMLVVRGQRQVGFSPQRVVQALRSG